MFDPAIDQDRGNRPYWRRLAIVGVVTLAVASSAMFALMHLAAA
jgi:hypothetical protein